ncbi:hypothetical protein F4805DRAFT_476654 [Annulohypoxylon moriforme]|nr:hypothetical protein F4805DRAFT_476654 [Annulohypoxylon moriforme]
MNNIDIAKAVAELRRYIDMDPRFTYHSFIAAGSYGSTHRIQYKNPKTQRQTDYVVKKAAASPSGRQSMREEREFLKRLRGGRHVVRLLNLPEDPLSVYGMEGEWIALEWLPNGTLERFVQRARAAGFTRLPNRLLWRFFLCLIRGLCAINWPRGREDAHVETEIPRPNEPGSKLTHNDLHDGNILMGDFSSGEHNMTPLLKIIDYGLMGEEYFATDAEEQAVRVNVHEMGQRMMELMVVDDQFELTLDFAMMFHQGQWIQTLSSAVTPREPGMANPVPGVDDLMVTIVGLCMATDEYRHFKPNLTDLTDWITTAIRERDQEFYGGYDSESNESIKQLCQDLILEP